MTASGRSVGERLEIAATVLLAVATVATAWSGYQASRWNGEQAKAGSRANLLRIEAGVADGRADTLSQIDVLTFSQWVNAYAQGQSRLAAFYFRRFRPEFAPVVRAWVATRPQQNRAAPLTPFAMPQYRLADRERATALRTESDAWIARSRAYVGRSTNYVLAVVLFASVLFFSGISTRLGSVVLRRVVLGLGVAMFVGTVAWLATQPVSFSF